MTAIDDLAAVAPIVVTETPRPSMRIRLIDPWVRQAMGCGLGWRDVIPALLVAFPGPEGEEAAVAVDRIRRLFGTTRSRAMRSAIDLAQWQARIADQANVQLPGIDGGAGGVKQAALIETLLRIIDKMAGGRSVARPDWHEPAPRPRPTPAAPSHAGHAAEPSRAKAGGGGSIAVSDPARPDHLSDDFWAPRPVDPNAKPPAPFLPQRTDPVPRSKEELFAAAERRRQQEESKPPALPPAS